MSASVPAVHAVFFSPTGSTGKVCLAAATAIAAAKSLPFYEHDLTPPSARASLEPFGPEDIVVAASPTYAGKLPNKILPVIERLLVGHGTRALAVTTFGNRSPDNSLAELASLMNKNGFLLAGAASVVSAMRFRTRLPVDVRMSGILMSLPIGPSWPSITRQRSLWRRSPVMPLRPIMFRRALTGSLRNS